MNGPGRPPNGLPGTPQMMPSRPGSAAPGAGLASSGLNPQSTLSKQNDAQEGQGGGNTNVDALMDAVGASGVDISAEEERMRLANERRRMQQQPGADRTRRQDFIEPQVLAEVVKKIAAAFQLRTLEPDTIPFIALAARHRLLALVTDAVKARNHRLNASHLRKPPLVKVPSTAATSSRKRKRNRMAVDREDDDDDDDENEEDDDDEDDDEEDEDRDSSDDEANKAPAWDVLIHDDPEKLLAALRRVDREEERRSRQERAARDEREKAEQARRDAAATAGGAEPNAAIQQSISKTEAVDRLVVGGSRGPSTPSTPQDQANKPLLKKKKKKELTETAQHKAMPEEVKKRLTDQVAMQSLGLKQYAWMNAGAAGGGGAGFSTPKRLSHLSDLPAPRFATPLGDLPPPTFTPTGARLDGSTTPGGGAAGPRSGEATPSVGGQQLTMADKLDVPSIHAASAADPHTVEMTDMMYALGRERGMGVGKGSGKNVLVRASSGVTLNKNKLLMQQQARQFDFLPPPPPMPVGANATAITQAPPAASRAPPTQTYHAPPPPPPPSVSALPPPPPMPNRGGI